MNMKEIFLTAVATATPYDVVFNKKRFVDIILDNPRFEKEFIEQITPEILSEAKDKGWYFILNIHPVVSGMYNTRDKLHLGLVGQDKLPTISITHYIK